MKNYNKKFINKENSKQQLNNTLLTVDKDGNPLNEEYVIFPTNPIKRPPNNNFRFDKHIIGKYKNRYYKFNTITNKWYHINKNCVLYRKIYNSGSNKKMKMLPLLD